jgi:hypothetical protein
LASARAEKGTMASKNLYYTLKHSDKKFDPEKAIPTAIRNNATEYLNPPVTNITYKGILKASSEIIKWFKASKDIENDFMRTAILMEKAGTGGALFRNLYRDFLKESYDLLKLDQLKTGHEAFIEIATLWTTVSQLFEKVSRTKDFEYIQQASDILKTISDKEKKAMELLVTI